MEATAGTLLGKYLVSPLGRCIMSSVRTLLHFRMFNFIPFSSAGSGDIQWCFSQVKGTVEEEVTEGECDFSRAVACQIMPSHFSLHMIDHRIIIDLIDQGLIDNIDHFVSQFFTDFLSFPDAFHLLNNTSSGDSDVSSFESCYYEPMTDASIIKSLKGIG